MNQETACGVGCESNAPDEELPLSARVNLVVALIVLTVFLHRSCGAW
jgi:hypothetical protein